MTSTSSKAIPFVALGIGFFLAVLATAGYDVPLEALMPLLSAMGLAGVPKHVIEKAIEARKQLQAGTPVNVVVDTAGNPTLANGGNNPNVT